MATHRPEPGRPETQPPARSAIHAQGLVRSFGAVRALDGLDLSAAPGRSSPWAVSNGAGKTTLLLILAGLLAPDGGRVVIAGADPLTQPPSHSARDTGLGDPLGELGTAVRAAQGESFGEGDSPPPLWPTGLALQLVLAVGGGAVATARLRVPPRRLAPGERVA